DFPSDAEHPPYDDVAWTLGYLYGVDVQAVDDTAVFSWSGLELLTDTVAYHGTVAGTGSTYVIAYRAQAEVLPMLYALREARARAFAADEAFSLPSVAEDGDAEEVSFPAGSIILERVDRA